MQNKPDTTSDRQTDRETHRDSQHQTQTETELHTCRQARKWLITGQDVVIECCKMSVIFSNNQITDCIAYWMN